MSAPRLNATSALARVELRHIRHFCAVAQELHFTRAAERLHLTQQALSTSVRQLEAQLGVELFQRSPRGVRLTAAGERLLRLGPALLDEVEEARHAVRRHATTAAHSPRLGYERRVGSALLPALLGAVRDFPEAPTCMARQMRPDELLAHLRAGMVELGLIAEPDLASDPHLRAHPVKREALVAVLGRDHPLAGEQAVTLARLAAVGRLALPPRASAPGLRDAVLARFADRGLEVGVDEDPRLEDESWMASEFVAGDAATLLPSCSADLLARWGVMSRRLAEDPLVEVVLVWDPSTESAAARALRRALVAAAAALGWSSSAPDAPPAATSARLGA